MKTTNLMIVGVGGQGSLLASKLLGRLLVDGGFDVKVSEVHGMSQRGGSVVTYVRYGEKVYSPVVAEGEADFIVSFEKLEGARYLKQLKPNGQIIVNSQQIDPMPVVIGAAEYPETVLDELKAKGVKIITVTENLESPLATAADVVLKQHVNRETDKWNAQGTTSTTALCMIFHALQAALIEETGYQAEQFALIHPGGAVGERLNNKAL